MSYVTKRAPNRYYTHVGPKQECAYCGEPAEQVDHATPASWLHNRIHLTESHRCYTVASCASCNASANKWFDLTFRQRRARIAKVVRRVNRHLLVTPTWSAEELDELGPMMRAEVTKGMRERDRVRRRLRVLESKALPEGVPNDMLQPLETAVA